MIKTVFDVSDAIKNNRKLHQIFTYLIEEVGELSTELNIHDGYSTKTPGKDGVVGEAVDAIICLLDIIRVYDPTITEEKLVEICSAKVRKWELKSSGFNPTPIDVGGERLEHIRGIYDVLVELGFENIDDDLCYDAYMTLPKFLHVEIDYWDWDTVCRDAVYMYLEGINYGK